VDSGATLSSRVRKPHTIMVPWRGDPSAPFLLEDRATENLKKQIGKSFCSEQKAGRGCSSARQGVSTPAQDPLPIHRELAPWDADRDIPLTLLSPETGAGTHGFPGVRPPALLRELLIETKEPQPAFPFPLLLIASSKIHHRWLPARSPQLRLNLSVGRRASEGPASEQRGGGDDILGLGGRKGVLCDLSSSPELSLI